MEKGINFYSYAALPIESGWEIPRENPMSHNCSNYTCIFFLLFHLPFLVVVPALSLSLSDVSCGECEEKCDIVAPMWKARSFGQDNNPTRRRLALSLSLLLLLSRSASALCVPVYVQCAVSGGAAVGDGGGV